MQCFNHPSFHLKSSHVTPVEYIPHLGDTTLILPQITNQPANQTKTLQEKIRQVCVDSLGLGCEFAEPTGLLHIAQVACEEAKFSLEGSSSPDNPTQAQCSTERTYTRGLQYGSTLGMPDGTYGLENTRGGQRYVVQNVPRPPAMQLGGDTRRVFPETNKAWYSQQIWRGELASTRTFALGFLLSQQPTPVFSSGESPGRRSLAGYSPRGHKESDTAERLTQRSTCCDINTHSPCSVSANFLIK